MIANTRGLKTLDVAITGGVNEVSPVTKVPNTGALEMVNFRISEDGQRVEKRDGLLEIVSAATLGAKDVFGYHTYYDGSANFCQLVITEEKIWRKVGAGAWAAIHTWASTLAHPVKVYDVQGKQIIITEIENKVIASDGSIYTLGITPPATIPTLTVGNDGSMKLDEDCADFSTPTWADNDTGTGASTLDAATFAPKTTFRFLCGAAAASVARRTAAVTVPEKFVFETVAYINTIGLYTASDYLDFIITGSRIKFVCRLDQQDLYIYDGSYYVAAGVTIPQDKFFTLKLFADTATPGEEYVDIYIDGISQTQLRCGYINPAVGGSTNHTVDIVASGVTVATDVYLDYIKLWDATNGKLNGDYLYAVVFSKSGNYGYKSNPIKSLLSAVSFSGAGLNDMTVTGTYTGRVNRTFRVYVETAAATDVIKWSMDDGVTWHIQGLKMAPKVYLTEGIEINFAAITGHTATNYWTFTASAIATTACYQKVALSSVPVSSDAQVNQRLIYRTLDGGTTYYLCAVINDNTTTAITDNLPDDILAYASIMEEGCEVPPLGKVATWWDERLWIADVTNNIVYYSDINHPEHFYSLLRYISFKRGEAQDIISQIVEYAGYLYIKKRNAIFMLRKKLSGAYGRYLVTKDFGTPAGWSVVEVNGLLMFRSYRGWEVFNGSQSFSRKFSTKVFPTLRTIDPAYPDYICAVHNRNKNEVWMSTPDRLSSAAARTFVFNYDSNAFYYFTFHKTPSYLGEARDSTGALNTYMGTRDGYVYQCNYGDQDGTTDISAYIRMPWIRFPQYYNIRKMDLEYELPSGAELAVKFYVNMEANERSTRYLEGNTPGPTDQTIRLPISDSLDLDLRGQLLSIRFSNEDSIGSDLKINSFTLSFAEMEAKGRIAGT